MTMHTPVQIKALLLEEFEMKKKFNATWAGTCDFCAGDIDEGQEFIFMGNKNKVCDDCQMQIIAFLEEL
jgi:hypothetical protein